MTAVHEALEDLRLVDHHCHGVVTADLDRPGLIGARIRAALPAALRSQHAR